MGKLGCRCGHIIRDQTDGLSYKAELIPDQQLFIHYEQLEMAIDDLITATQQGRRKQWIREMFTQQYPTDLTDQQMLIDLFDRYCGDYRRQVFQCESCGRVYIQRGKTNRFASFMPEDENGLGILSVSRPDIDSA